MKFEAHWYFITYTECPMCGRSRTFRERRFDPRPADPLERTKWEPDNLCASTDVAWGL